MVVKQQKRNTFPYFVNNCYSLGYWLKDYGYYPKDLPLFTYMDHGMTLSDTIPIHEVTNDSPLIFKFSPRLVAEYRKKYRKPAYSIINPSVHFRKKYNITQSKSAKGSLFFVAHSTPLIDDLTEWSYFIDTIKTLPSFFEPIDICIHPTDLKKGLGVIFENAGFKVQSAANGDSETFVENFYNLLKNYKYTLSNFIGSYTFYSVEMGIPFSLFGEEPKYHNRGDENIELGEYGSYKEYKAYKKALSLFNGFHCFVNPQQLEFVDRELGKVTTISRRRTAYLLYKALIIQLIKHPSYVKYLIVFMRTVFAKFVK